MKKFYLNKSIIYVLDYMVQPYQGKLKVVSLTGTVASNKVSEAFKGMHYIGQKAMDYVKSKKA